MNPSEIFVVLLSSGGAVSALTGVIFAWLSRDKTRQVRVSITTSDGKKILLTAWGISAEQAAVLVRRALEHPEESVEHREHEAIDGS
jgi:hypothetical protein